MVPYNDPRIFEQWDSDDKPKYVAHQQSRIPTYQESYPNVFQENYKSTLLSLVESIQEDLELCDNHTYLMSQKLKTLAPPGDYRASVPASSTNPAWTTAQNHETDSSVLSLGT